MRRATGKRTHQHLLIHSSLPQPLIPAPSRKKPKDQPHAFLLNSAPACFFFLHRQLGPSAGLQCLDYGKAASKLDYVFLIWRQQEGGAVPGNANSGFAGPAAILPSLLLTSPDLMGSLAGPRGLLWGGHNSQLTSVPPSVPNLTPSSLPQFLSSAGFKMLAQCTMWLST